MTYESMKAVLCELKRYREALEEIAECELGFEGQVARKALGKPEPGEPTTGSNQESWVPVQTGLGHD